MEKHGHGVESQSILPPAERAEELVMMGLRLTGDIDKKQFARRAGQELADSIDAGQLQDLVAGGFLEDSQTSLKATAHGQRVLNAVIAALLA